MTKLKNARIDAGWSQSQLVAAMMRVAPTLAVSLPDLDSLKTNIRRWENDRVVPGAEYRKVLRGVYGLSDTELGFTTASVTNFPVLGTHQVLSSEGLAYLETLLATHISADNLLGPRQVLQLVEHEAHLLNRAVRDARGTLRRKAIKVAMRYNEFLGWLQQDCGLFESAMFSTDRATDFALELRDPLWDGYLLMRKSNIATDSGDPLGACAMADAALIAVPASPPRTHAVLLRQRANAQAALGNAKECAIALEQSVAEVQRPEDDGDQFVGYCTERYVVMEAAACWTQLKQPARALQVLSESQDESSDAHRRDEGLRLARSATAHAGVGDVERACYLGNSALTLAESTLSARTIAELRRLRGQLTRAERQDTVRQLISAVASLVGRTA